MKFLGVIAHLFHPFKAQVAFVAHVQLLLVCHLFVLHQFLDFAKFFSACFAFMFFKQDLTTIPLVPTTPAQISLNLPCRLWMVEKSSQSVIARRAEIQLLVVFCVLFRKTILAHEGARLHLPLPPCFDSVFVLADLLPADRAPVWSISLRILYIQEFLCLVDMTVAAK